MKIICEYVYQNYVFDPETKTKKTNFYAFACSLGALILGLYAQHDAENAS